MAYNKLNSQNFSIEALDRVGEFYKQSFDQLSTFYADSFFYLMWYLMAIGAIAGVIAPLAAWYIQTSKIEKIKEELKKDILRAHLESISTQALSSGDNFKIISYALSVKVAIKLQELPLIAEYLRIVIELIESRGPGFYVSQKPNSIWYKETTEIKELIKDLEGAKTRDDQEIKKLTSELKEKFYVAMSNRK
jgi:hypothetical protein